MFNFQAIYLKIYFFIEFVQSKASSVVSCSEWYLPWKREDTHFFDPTLVASDDTQEMHWGNSKAYTHRAKNVKNIILPSTDVGN